jgi:2C-methyl-D-erythritol 2,4-cyclodiphosphate synthase
MTDVEAIARAHLTAHSDGQVTRVAGVDACWRAAGFPDVRGFLYSTDGESFGMRLGVFIERLMAEVESRKE